MLVGCSSVQIGSALIHGTTLVLLYSTISVDCCLFCSFQRHSTHSPLLGRRSAAFTRNHDVMPAQPECASCHVFFCACTCLCLDSVCAACRQAVGPAAAAGKMSKGGWAAWRRRGAVPARLPLCLLPAHLCIGLAAERMQWRQPMDCWLCCTGAAVEGAAGSAVSRRSVSHGFAALDHTQPHLSLSLQQRSVSSHGQAASLGLGPAYASQPCTPLPLRGRLRPPGLLGEGSSACCSPGAPCSAARRPHLPPLLLPQVPARWLPPTTFQR